MGKKVKLWAKMGIKQWGVVGRGKGKREVGEGNWAIGKWAGKYGFEEWGRGRRGEIRYG